ncbi:hypothetical protein HDU91_001553, partial [Kappamyces sp. JEL0680]
MHCTEENFYQNQIKQSLETTRTTKEERAKMVQLLKQQWQDDSQDELDLAPVQDRFEGLNMGTMMVLTVDTAGVEEILSRLTVQEIQSFEQAVASSMHLLVAEWKPWWLQDPAPASAPKIQILGELPTDHSSLATNAQIPASIPYPAIKTSSNPDLAYSVIDLVFSYVCAARSMNGDLQDESEAVRLVLSTSHVLSTTPSSFVYKSILEVVEMARHLLLTSPFKFLPSSLPLFLADTLRILAQRSFLLA